MILYPSGINSVALGWFLCDVEDCIRTYQFDFTRRIICGDIYSYDAIVWFAGLKHSSIQPTMIQHHKVNGPADVATFRERSDVVHSWIWLIHFLQHNMICGSSQRLLYSSKHKSFSKDISHTSIPPSYRILAILGTQWPALVLARTHATGRNSFDRRCRVDNDSPGGHALSRRWCPCGRSLAGYVRNLLYPLSSFFPRINLSSVSFNERRQGQGWIGPNFVWWWLI